MNFDLSQVAALANRLALLDSQRRKVAISRGLLKVGKQGATAAKSEISRIYNVKAGVVAQRIRVVAGEKKVEIKAARRNARSNRIPLMDFGAKEKNGQGVTFSVVKGRKQRLRHAFVATMKSGHEGVYQKKKNTGKLSEALGIDVTHMMVGKRVLPIVISKINAKMSLVIAHELHWEIKRLLAK